MALGPRFGVHQPRRIVFLVENHGCLAMFTAKSHWVFNGFIRFIMVSLYLCLFFYGFIIILANILQPHGLSETAHLHLPQSGGAPAMFVA
jgi:hypothetical protein